jgi:hypothetical protein
MTYGVAVHSALQTAQNLINKDQFNLNEVIDAYRKSLESQQPLKANVDRYLPHGIKVLENLFNKHEFNLPKGGLAEVVISHNQLGNVPLNGTLDNVYLFKDGPDTDALVISDYKTGMPLSSFDTRAQNKAIKAWRHRNQLLFYCLLASGTDRFNSAKNIKAQMIYVEAEDSKDLFLSLQPEKSELDRLTKLIAAVWQRIISLDLPETKHYPENLEGIKAFEEDLLKGQ